MDVKKIDAVSAPSPGEFYRGYVLAQRPAIFTGLFDDSPLRKVDTLESAQTALAAVPVEIRTNFMAAYLGATAPRAPRTMTLGAYLKLLRDDPETLDVCVEQPTPQFLLEQLPLKPYRDIQDEDDLYSNMFVAGHRNYAHLHYDADQRDVLMYQVFGTKRISVIHPRESDKLDPLDWTDLRRTSAILVENTSEQDRAAFIEYTNGCETLLRPGETMFIPAMAWHYVEYVSPAMSIAYRLGRNPYNRRLAALFPNPPLDVQALALLLLDPHQASARHSAWLEELEAIKHSPGLDEAQRSGLLRQRCLSIRAKYAELRPPYSIREWQRRQSSSLEASSLQASLPGGRTVDAATHRAP